MAGQEDPVQREIHQDWANREYIEVITSSIKKIADFLNSFGDQRRDPDLDLIMGIHGKTSSNYFPTLHPKAFWTKCAGLHHPYWGIMWTIFLYYMAESLCCFYLMTHLYTIYGSV
uniref:Uncharacterized protein n=1 Tax=Xiphophorus maculatus TaxID=8083 RepID=A0A3B5R7X7_XIPMA